MLHEYTSSRLINTTKLLQDIYQQLSTNKYKINKNLIHQIILLYEQKVKLKSSVHKKFLDFVQNHFGGSSINSTVKGELLSLIQRMTLKFGERYYKGFPKSLIKEFKNMQEQAQREFDKTIHKLAYDSADKRTRTLQELSEIKDENKIKMFWSNTEFLKFIKRFIITEHLEINFEFLMRIMENYLKLKEENSSLFILTNYIYVFHQIMVFYFDVEDKDQAEFTIRQEKAPKVKKNFNLTVKVVGPTDIFNCLLNFEQCYR